MLAFAAFIAPAALAQPVHGIAMHGTPALPEDFKFFPYVNPDVKKGGRLAFGVVGTFNNLNSFILKAKRTTARGMWDPELGNLVVESLMMRSRDEPFTMYGLLAETVEWDDARTYIQFNLNPNAKWSDGKPVTPEDVMFTFELLRDKGRPPFSTRLKRVAKMEKVGEHSVKFTFNELADREFPLLLALSPVLPKHATKVDGFDETTLVPQLGSGPYLVKQVKPGEKIVYKRDPNYWAKDIPSKVGFDNFDEISIEYFLQENTLFEAFKKGEIDVYKEGSPKKWERTYDFPAVRSGDVIKDTFKPGLPANMYSMVFNTRRPVFTNAKLREGLTLAFDFEWVNKNLYENAYKRTESFWQNSVLSSLGRPASDKELALLGEAAKRIDPKILDGTYRLPVTDATGRDRKVLKQAYDLMRAAGYMIDNGKMRDSAGKPLTFEILTQNQDQERIALAYKRSLAALGIDISIRTVDDSQYQERTQRFDFDMIMRTYASSLSPGLEQTTNWGSESRDVQASENMAGVADPDIDRMIENILSARTGEDFQAAVRAHDRLLLAGHYVIPLYHIGEQWIARWKRIGHPAYVPLYGAQLPTWWDQRVQ
ncbi:ABC transporter substrate-binding protein [Rhizobium sp. KVB221]|uniref:ABC transporter substrate-binding protein n=1 Tax=Rhizobium setariae TaxID=2801340 RepID=A0A936YUN6_9HYPH|nr:extracellular solute-binding protein [Rhizobium setariae]MBL0372975.1 ABC transporter substrate-binding protein [Rhizobium setariae]